MTSNGLKRPQMTSKESSPIIETVKRKKNKLKGGANTESNNDQLDEILHINNLYRGLAMQIISIDRSLRSNTIQDSKEFYSQSLSKKV